MANRATLERYSLRMPERSNFTEIVKHTLLIASMASKYSTLSKK